MTTCSVFISHFFSNVLSHCSLSNGVYSTSPHSETSTQNSPLCKSTNSLASRLTLSSVCPLTGYHPASSSAYDVANNAITWKIFIEKTFLSILLQREKMSRKKLATGRTIFTFHGYLKNLLKKFFLFKDLVFNTISFKFSFPVSQQSSFNTNNNSKIMYFEKFDSYYQMHYQKVVD